MGVGVTDAGDCTAQADGAGAAAWAGDAGAGNGGHESARQSLGLRVTEDRVLIRADREDHAPTQTASGLYTASSLAAAVEGTDEAESWFVGTIVQRGPLVNHMDCRPFVIRELESILVDGVQIFDEGMQEYFIDRTHLDILLRQVKKLPREMPEPLAVGNRVAFSWAAGQQIAVNDEKYLIMRASDVLAVLEE